MGARRGRAPSGAQKHWIFLEGSLTDVFLFLVRVGQAQRHRARLDRRLRSCAGHVERQEHRRPLALVLGGQLVDDGDGLVGDRRGCSDILGSGAVPDGPANGTPAGNGSCNPMELIVWLIVGDSTRERCSTQPQA